MSFPDFPHEPEHREPVFNMPFVVVVLGLAMVGVHALRGLLSDQAEWTLVAALAFVPARLSLWLGAAELQQVLQPVLGIGDWSDLARAPQVVQMLLADGGAALWSLVTYGLLHGSMTHLATNTLWLAAFGSPVARRLGARNFFILLAVSTVAGALAHWLADPLALSPLVGASAGISGTTAAAARFVFAPGVRMGALADDWSVRAIPAEPLLRVFANPRAFAFIAVWFAANLIFGAGLVALTGEDVSIAWQAHIGGFIAGLALFPLIDQGNRRA